MDQQSGHRVLQPGLPDLATHSPAANCAEGDRCVANWLHEQQSGVASVLCSHFTFQGMSASMPAA